MRTSLKGREVRGVLTKGLGRPDCAAQMTGGEVRVATAGGVAVRWCASSEIPTRAGPKSWKEGSVEFLVPRRSSCASCGGGGAVERRVLGGAGCSAQQSKARRAELGFCGGCGGEDGVQGGRRGHL